MDCSVGHGHTGQCQLANGIHTHYTYPDILNILQCLLLCSFTHMFF
jgi:hypothetical protein